MSKYSAGDLLEQITFIVPTKVDDGLRSKNVYSDGDSVRANVKWVSDRERFGPNAIKNDIRIRVVVRTREIKRDWKLRHKGIEYSIIGYKPLDKSFIEITCGANE